MATPQILTVSNVKRVANIQDGIYKKVLWRTVHLSVKPVLSLDEYCELINNIVGMCDSTGLSMTGLVDFYMRVNVVASYAFVELPEDINELYLLMYGTDLYEVVTSVVSKSQLDSIADFARSYMGGCD